MVWTAPAVPCWPNPWSETWAPALPDPMHEPMMVAPPEIPLDPSGNGMQSVPILPESPVFIGPSGSDVGLASFGAKDLQTAMVAAHTASNACGSGCMPLAARQVANGLWCVLVSDPSIGGVAGFDAAASLQVESVSVSGMEHGHCAAPTMNLSLAEHLAPIPEYDSPRTPPPKSTSNDMLPTPSPVSYRRVKQEEEMSWKAAKQTPVWPQHTGDLNSAAILQDHAILSVAHAQSAPQQSQTMMANGRMTPLAVQACVLEAVAKNPSLGDALMNEPSWESTTWREKPKHSYNKAPRCDWWESDSNTSKRAAPRQKRGRKYKARDLPGEFHRDEVEDRAAKDEWPKDETEGGLLGKTVWYLIEKVLLQRPHLEAGKRVTVPFPHWVHHLPASSNPYSWTHGSSDEKRSLVNRALRTMTKKLPGCCWTVDMQKEEMQVHLADVARFSRFCDGM
eukprot:symbB.v1.2.000873.t1/scaffold38.1/size396883/13